MKDFYTVLPSNGCADTHPDNEANSYTISWDRTLELKEEDNWTVALSEINFQYNIQTVDRDYGFETFKSIEYFEITLSKLMNFNFVHEKSGLRIKQEGLLPLVFALKGKGHYGIVFSDYADAKACGFTKLTIVSRKGEDISAEDVPFSNRPITFMLRYETTFFISERHQFHKAYYYPDAETLEKKVNELVNGIARFAYDKIGNKFQLLILDPKSFSSFLFLNGMHYVMGFRSPVISVTPNGKSQMFIAEYSPQLNRGINSIYVYSSICQDMIVGGTFVPLLRSLWLDNSNRKYGEISNIVLKHPMYVPVKQNSINSIEINLRTDVGDLFPFSEGSVTSITLHFKKNG